MSAVSADSQGDLSHDTSGSSCCNFDYTKAMKRYGVQGKCCQVPVHRVDDLTPCNRIAQQEVVIITDDGDDVVPSVRVKIEPEDENFRGLATARVQPRQNIQSRIARPSHPLFHRGNLREASPLLVQALGLGTALPPKPREFKCEMCTATFLTRQARNHHMTEQHQLIFKCTARGCSKTFVSRQGMMDHRKTHDDASKKFECQVCGKKFLYASKLLEHQVSHQDPQVPCEECDKLFRDEAGVRKHRAEVHMPSQRVYSCPIASCNYSVGVLRYVKEHVVRQHQIALPAKFFD